MSCAPAAPRSCRSRTAGWRSPAWTPTRSAASPSTSACASSSCRNRAGDAGGGVPRRDRRIGGVPGLDGLRCPGAAIDRRRCSKVSGHLRLSRWRGGRMTGALRYEWCGSAPSGRATGCPAIAIVFSAGITLLLAIIIGRRPRHRRHRLCPGDDLGRHRGASARGHAGPGRAVLRRHGCDGDGSRVPLRHQQGHADRDPRPDRRARGKLLVLLVLGRWARSRSRCCSTSRITGLFLDNPDFGVDVRSGRCSTTWATASASRWQGSAWRRSSATRPGRS